MGKITPNGIYLEQLETEPWKYIPDIREADLHDDVVKASVVTMVSVSKRRKWCCGFHKIIHL